MQFCSCMDTMEFLERLGGCVALGAAGAPGWGIPILMVGVRGAAEPIHLSVRWCVRGFTSCKFQETPQEAHPGRGLGAARAPSQQMCLQGREAVRKSTNLSVKTFVCSQ